MRAALGTTRQPLPRSEDVLSRYNHYIISHSPVTGKPMQCALACATSATQQVPLPARAGPKTSCGGLFMHRGIDTRGGSANRFSTLGHHA